MLVETLRGLATVNLGSNKVVIPAIHAVNFLFDGGVDVGVDGTLTKEYVKPIASLALWTNASRAYQIGRLLAAGTARHGPHQVVAAAASVHGSVRKSRSLSCTQLTSRKHCESSRRRESASRANDRPRRCLPRSFLHCCMSY